MGQVFWVIKFRDRRVCPVEEDCLEQCEWILALAFGRGCEREVHGKRLSTVERLAAEGDLAEDDGESERLLGVVVGRRHTRDLKEGEHLFHNIQLTALADENHNILWFLNKNNQYMVAQLKAGFIVKITY